MEGLWSQIKRLSNNFSGISIGSIEKLYHTDIEKKNYLVSWICYALFFREVEREKLSRKGKINLLIKYIKISIPKYLSFIPLFTNQNLFYY